MIKQLYSNNARATLSASISNSATSFSVATGLGALFKAPSGSEFELVTLTDGYFFEVVKVTGRTGDTFTVVRGQDGTSGLAWATGTTVESRITASTLNRLFQNQAFEASDAISINGGNASGTHSIAIGSTTAATATGSQAYGYTNTSSGVESIAMGSNNTANAQWSIAIGTISYASGAQGVALGYNASAQGIYSVAIGGGSYASGNNNVAVGKAASAQGNYCTAIGPTAGTYADYNVSIGFQATSQGSNTISMGNTANTFANYAMALGYQSIAQNISDLAIGKLSHADGASSVAIGILAHSSGGSSIAIGDTSFSNGYQGISVGANAYASQGGCISIGVNAGIPVNPATTPAWIASHAYTKWEYATIYGVLVQAMCNGTSGTTPPTLLGSSGVTALDNTVVWRDLHCDSEGNQLTVGTYSRGVLGIGYNASGFGIAIGPRAFSIPSSMAIGEGASAMSWDSITIGHNALSYNIDASLSIARLPSMQHPPDWRFGNGEYLEYVGLSGMLESEVLDLTGGAAWTATSVVKHGWVRRPTTPNGNQYSRWDNNYNIWNDPTHLAYNPGHTSGTQPTWPTGLGNSVDDGDGTWICVPNNGDYIIWLPAPMLVEEILFVCYEASGITVQAHISIGTTGNLTKAVNNQPTVGLTANNTVCKWTLSQPVMLPDISIKIDALATGTTMLGRFIFKGFYTKHWLP